MADLVAAGVLALAGFFGWRKGTLLMLLGLAALGAGYVGAALLFRPVGNWIAATFPRVPPFIALPLGGALVMFAITGLIRLATLTVQRRRALMRQQGESPLLLDSAGGALVGAAQASVYVVLAAWALMSLRAVTRQGPDISGTLTGRATAAVTKRLTYAVTSRITGDPFTATMMSVVATHPREGVQAVNTLLRNPHVRGLLENPQLRQALAHADVQALANNAAVKSLATDRSFLDAASQLGFAPGQPGGQAMAQALATNVAPLARAVQELTSDDQVQRILNSPDFKRMIEQGDFRALASDPRFNQLANRLFESLRRGATSP